VSETGVVATAQEASNLSCVVIVIDDQVEDRATDLTVVRELVVLLLCESVPVKPMSPAVGVTTTARAQDRGVRCRLNVDTAPLTA
jgi:hypothetical protein